MKTEIYWEWEEAFSKFGFGDGDGPNFTHLVVDFIDSLGYEAFGKDWGLHNYMIVKILDKDGNDIMKQSKREIEIGYDDPRDYLPSKIVKALDENFPPETHKE